MAIMRCVRGESGGMWMCIMSRIQKTLAGYICFRIISLSMILGALEVGEFAKQEGIAREESLKQSSEEPQHILPIPTPSEQSQPTAEKKGSLEEREDHGVMEAKGRGF